jgi:NAD(P)-dependent dehydrogenase (short-subunit alcohol dehydrogenase family)
MSSATTASNNLAGEVAVVTGAGRGLGRAIALALAKAGAAVMATARSADEIEETVSLISESGARAAASPADVTDVGSLTAMLAAAEAKLGTPTLLVNNAGGGVPGSSGPFETIAPESIVAGLQVNLLGAMLLSRLALPGMLARGEGRIINVSSGAAMLGMPFLAPYSVSKTGLVRFSEILALELHDRGVKVFSMAPGNVRTALTEPLYHARHTIAANPPADFSWVFPPGAALEDEGWYPPERGAELAAFLASGKADRLSGRFFSVHYDEAEMVAQVDRIERDQLYALRISTPQGIEMPIFYPEPPFFYRKNDAPAETQDPPEHR